jgi:hypothetical protein
MTAPSSRDAVAREWLCKRHVSIPKVKYAAMEILLGSVFCGVHPEAI